MKKLINFFKSWIKDGEAELEIALEWYDMLLIGSIVIYGIVKIVW